MDSVRSISLCLLLLLAFLVGGRSARGDDYEDRLKPGHCSCPEGKGTWEYLRSPLARPEEAPRCGLLLARRQLREPARARRA